VHALAIHVMGMQLLDYLHLVAPLAFRDKTAGRSCASSRRCAFRLRQFSVNPIAIL
jgi:hypothetical protein